MSAVFEQAVRLVWGSMALGLAIVLMAGLVALVWTLIASLGVGGVAAALGVLIFLGCGYLFGRAALP